MTNIIGRKSGEHLAMLVADYLELELQDKFGDAEYGFLKAQLAGIFSKFYKYDGTIGYETFDKIKANQQKMKEQKYAARTD